jgi:threonine dehydratase
MIKSAPARPEWHDVRVIGIEATASTAVSAAVQAGEVVQVRVGETIADGLAGNLELGSVTVELVRESLDGLVTVTEGEIASAIRYLATAHGVVAEGAGAASVAAVLAGKVSACNVLASDQVVAIVSGRNITAAELAAILA